MTLGETMDNLAFIKICDDNIDRLQTAFPSMCTSPETILERAHACVVFTNNNNDLLIFWLNAKIEFIKRQAIINELDSCPNT